MSIKRILVPVTGTESDTGSIETAIAAARRFDGHVEALYIRPDPNERLGRIVHGEGTSIRTGAIGDFLAGLERAGQHARERFLRILQAHAIPLEDPARPAGLSGSWREETDAGGQTLARHAGLVDLIVVGRPGAHVEPLPDHVNAALFTAGHPVLVAPPVGRAKFGDFALVAWNPTVQAERAVMRALPLLKQARRVAVVTVGEEPERGMTTADAARYLAWHGVQADLRQIAPDSRGIGEVLLAAALESGADLLVMGAYSHSRWREMILGGVTRHVLAHAELPVLMAH